MCRTLFSYVDGVADDISAVKSHVQLVVNYLTKHPHHPSKLLQWDESIFKKINKIFTGSKILTGLFAKTIAKKENKHFRLNVTPNLKIHSAKNFKQAIKIIHPPANNFKLIGNILHVDVNFTYVTERINSF